MIFFNNRATNQQQKVDKIEKRINLRNQSNRSSNIRFRVSHLNQINLQNYQCMQPQKSRPCVSCSHLIACTNSCKRLIAEP